MLALLEIIAAEKHGANIGVLMPYADSLKFMADWYAQLWAESLGKKLVKDGKVLRFGQTPVKSLGVTDQHSQVQLYTDGPFDKTITFISVENTAVMLLFRMFLTTFRGLRFYPDTAWVS